jgi:hypothetical protein
VTSAAPPAKERELRGDAVRRCPGFVAAVRAEYATTGRLALLFRSTQPHVLVKSAGLVGGRSTSRSVSGTGRPGS